MSAVIRHLDTLASLAHPQGGWGYGPGQSAHLEPTCLALLALSGDGTHAALCTSAWAFVESCRGPDSFFRTEKGRHESVWTTSLVLFTQAALGRTGADLVRTIAALVSLSGRRVEEQPTGEVHDIDLKLIGWPWADGNFSWAEPTAWACLALRRAGHGHHPRVAVGLQMLLDRAFDKGGINYGNRSILGRLTEPIPGPTAAMLLALQGHGDKPRVTASAFYLTEKALGSTDIEHLGWAYLALLQHRDQPGVTEALPAIEERLRTAHAQRQSETWLSPSVMREALTALALGPARDLFALPRETDTRVIEPAPRVVRRASLGERLRSTLRGITVETANRLRVPEPGCSVHIATAGDYNCNLSDILLRQYAEFRSRVPLKGKRVVLKPNLVEYHREKVINTHPHVVAAAIDLCRREGAAEVIVAEGPGHWRNVEYLVQASGLGDVLRETKTPFVDLNHDEPVKTLNLGRLTGLEYLYLARTIASADVVISLPKLKTHHWAGATLSMKNLFGTLPGICYGWPKNELHCRGIDRSIVDIALTRTPDLAIVDGIVGMEGDGPINGTPKPFGALIMGNDLLAVDATCVRLMKLRPEKIGYLVMGLEKRLGLFHEKDIRQVGETLASLAQPFATVPHHDGIKVAIGGPL